ncbi:Multicopper oxidase with three cupredoxin domains, partial [Geosmithia morbida]
VTYAARGEQRLLYKLTVDQNHRRSDWGTLRAPTLPSFLRNNPLPNGFPWSNRDSRDNYYTDPPHTGVIRSYDFTIGQGKISPDGYERDVLLVNGQFPGPLIEANWGDTIQVTVHNNLTDPVEGTALHWHGLLQKGTPWEDGVPAVTQCPIAPGKSFTYQFLADLYGTSWYHSHYSAQYAGGLSGPMVIHGPKSRAYDIDVGPVMLSDWYHDTYMNLVEQSMAPNALPLLSDNNLINGKMNFDCSTLPETDKTPCVNNAGVSKFKFQRGKTHLLRLINVGAEALQRFSIDGHNMTVVANDYVQVQPYTTDIVTLGVGQRTDVLVKADGDLDAYWMRSSISTICSLTNQPDALAAIYYDDADQSEDPQSQPEGDLTDPGNCANDDLERTRPVMQLRVPQPDLTFNMSIGNFQNETGTTLWTLDDVSYRGNYNSPTLLLATLNNHTFEDQWNVKNTKSAKSVRVIVQNGAVAHPMHLHGFNMYILSEGDGEWDGTIVHPENPQRRDVIQLRPNGHLVMQFDAAQNPGMWAFHCHIAWHVGAGLYAQFLTAPDKLAKMKPPSVVAETCRQWAEWTHTNIPPQIDSGL